MSAKKDIFGAFMFFVTYLVILVGFSTVFVHCMGMAGFADKTDGSFFDGGHLNTLVGSFFVLWMGGTVLSKRNMTSDIMAIMIVMAGVYLSWTTNVMLGMVPIALLTTLGK